MLRERPIVHRATQESEWPATSSEADEDNTAAAARWRRLRNVVRAMAAFRFFGKNGGLKVRGLFYLLVFVNE